MNVQSVESMVDQMMTILFVLCGIYCVVLFLLRGKTDLMKKAKFLYPQGYAPEACRNIQGYLSVLMPRVLALGIGLIVFGTAGILFAQSMLATLLLMILPLCLLGWYVAGVKKLAQKYWRRP